MYVAIFVIKQNYCFIAISIMLKIWEKTVIFLADVPDAIIKEKTKAIVQKNVGLNLLKCLIEKDPSVLNIDQF